MAGYFVGNVFSTGLYMGSDAMLKQNVQNLNNATSIINQLDPKTFEYKNATYPQLNFPDGEQMGLIAQDVEQILPNIVGEATHPAEYDSLGVMTTPALTFKTVKYEQFIPLLLAGFQEQTDSIQTLNQDLSSLNSQLSDLEARLESLEECLANTGICNEDDNQSLNQSNFNERNKSTIDIELNDAQNIVLEQNVPNPFAERTTINYSIPVNIQKAQMHFYNQNGQLINTVEIDERGEGQLNVFANDLSTGVYTYTLVVDGQISATKRMVRTK